MEHFDKLYFLCQWDKVREKTWSGTCFSLFQALQSQFQIVDIPIHTPFYSRILRKFKLFPPNFPSQADLSLYRRLHSKRYPRKDASEKSMIFQFTDYLNDNAYRSTCVYQDLSINYVMQLSAAHPERFELSNFMIIPPRELRRRSKAELEYYRGCRTIFTMGQWLARYLVDELGIDRQKVYHVGGGINIDRSLIGDGQQRKRNKILFIGRDFKRKGGYLTYEAFRILQRELMPNAELFVAGPATDPINLPCQAYHFMGECSQTQLANLLNTCDIFCMPSYFEAYGLVFVEALSFGLPCIGRNLYEMPYFIKDGANGYLIEKDDASLLARKMYDLLNNQDIQNSVRAMRDFYMAEYSWDSVAARIKQGLNG